MANAYIPGVLGAMYRGSLARREGASQPRRAACCGHQKREETVGHIPSNLAFFCITVF